MKKILLLLGVGINSLFLSAQENNKFRLGLQSGWQSNRSQYAGGMTSANARFHKNPFGAMSFDIIARYDFNRHWMIMSGLGINSLGFEFGIAENYSFTEKSKRWTSVNTGFRTFEMPVLGAYKFNPNCKNWRWIVSAGFTNIMTSSQNQTRQLDEVSDAVVSPENSYLSSQESMSAGSHLTSILMVGREKTFKSGSILNVSLIFNRGFSEIARTTVNYNIDGQNYSHDFINKGSYIGFRVSYFLRPFKGSEKNKTKQSKPKSTSVSVPAPASLN
jgi:hypothetical protein